MTPQPDKSADTTQMQTRAGIVAVVGAPNAGKSTLTNRLVGGHISIVTPKVQTTRSRITGIAILGASQVVLLDTPGIFAPKRRLDRAMVAQAWRTVEEADQVLLLVDAQKISEALPIAKELGQHRKRALLALNKIDQVPRQSLLKAVDQLTAEAAFAHVFMISALTGDGVDDLARILEEEMPAGPWLYPEDQLADIPQRLWAAELTREQLFLMLHQELPYHLTVETEDFQTTKKGELRLEQVIYVSRDNYKAMLLGHKGNRIKEIGQRARRQMKESFGVPVHLFLHVKVRPKWLENPAHYRELGLTFHV